MKQNIILSVLTLLLYSCGVNSQPQRIPFFEKEKIAITIPATFNDTVKGRFLFDTGVSKGLLVLDSAFCAKNPLSSWSGEPDHVAFSHNTGWDNSKNPKYRQRYYQRPTKVTISDTKLAYDYILVRNQKLSSDEDLQGTIGLPYNDSTHIWELNFENNYLEIHDSRNFRRPEKCYWFPINREPSTSHTMLIQFPITVKNSDGESITINYPYIIDTGMAKDFVLLPNAKEIDFFRKRDDAIIVQSGFGGYHSRYDVNTTVFDDFEIDSMRIYTDEYAEHLISQRVYGLIGLNFMKRFNVFFDLSTQQVGFQPINNFTRIVDKKISRHYMSINVKPDGRQFVEAIPDKIKNNYYKNAGVRVGDEIIAINGIKVAEMSPEDAAKIKRSTTRDMEIIRDGKPLKITVQIAEDDLKGD